MRIKTLGGLKLEGSDFQRAKALLLVTYLALEGEQDRRHLADLFWQGSTKQLHNLSMTLTRLRQAGDDLIDANDVSVASHIANDVLDLQKAFQAEAYEEVIKLYTGPFLEGIASNRLGIELEEWVYQQREYYASLARDALLANATQKAQAGTFKEAALAAAKAYHLRYAPEPEEEELEQLYLLLQADKHLLAKEVGKEAASFGLALSFSQEEAKVKVSQSNQEGSEANSKIIHNLPIFPTAFVGREQEITSITERLLEKDTRLLSIIAQGGMGKTRLAVEVGHKLLELDSNFKDGIYFVSFVSTPNVEQIPFTLGDALHFSFMGQGSPKEQLLNYLKDKTYLLILDNLEHLIEGATFINDILLSAAKLSMLVTSRESLNLRIEQIYELKGLSFENEKQRNQLSSDAVQLFVRAAHFKQPDFELNEKTTAEVLKLCQLVAGMPLALELSASWLRSLSLQSIVEEIQTGIDLLATSTRDLPQRHQSIRAVFDYSWQLLSEREQTLMRKLAVFQGGFSREAAKQVVAASIADLAALIDKSLLTKAGSNRYQRHPLVIQYSQEKLAETPSVKEQVEKAHAAYFLTYIRQVSPKIRSLERKASLEKLAPDLTNIRKAWFWLVDQGDLDQLVRTYEAIDRVFEDRKQEAHELFHYAVNALDENNPKHLKALGRGRTYENGYALIFSRQHLKVAKALLERTEDYEGMAIRMDSIFDFTDTTVDISEYKNALAFTKKYGRPEDYFSMQHRYLMYLRNTGKFEDVVEAFEAALKEVNTFDEPLSKAFISTIYGAYLVYNQHIQPGIKRLEEALHLFETLNHHISIGVNCELGYAYFKLGGYEEAQQHLRISLKGFTELGNLHFQAKCHGYLGRIAVAKKDLGTSRDHTYKALKLASQGGETFHITENLVGFADYLQASNNQTKAVEILSFVKQNPLAEKRDQNQAQELLEEIKLDLPLKDFEAAIEKGKTLELNQVVQEALHLTRKVAK